ncbi:MAG: GAF domain-containing protein [Anaerolineae bacterium]|nr:GAF domain-containing protein [Anaerolineae bacterium]
MVDKTTRSTTQTEKQRERTTVGLVITDTIEVWEQLPWQGAEDATREHDVNLLVFVGRGLKDEYDFGVQANAIYALVSPELVDGFVTGGAFGTFVAPEVARDFCERHRPLPVVTFEQAISGFPGVLLDDYHSMRQVITHLIEVHGCRRIAFTGELSSSHLGFRERYRAYVETLQAYDLPFDQKLVYSGMDEGEQSKWIEEIVSDIDALTGQEDRLVLRGLHALQSLGVRVPGDVAVAAYNDLKDSRVATPPLTTVRPPFYGMAKRATETLLALLAGEQVPEQEMLEGQLIVRQSCGCIDPTVAQAAVGPVERTGETLKTALAARREEILAEMAQIELPTTSVDAGWPGRLLDAFVAALAPEPPESPGLFLQELDDVLQQTMTAADGDVAVLHGTLSALRRNTLPYLNDKALPLAEDLWQQARAMIGQTVARAQAYQAFQAERRTQMLRETRGALVTTFDLGSLMDVLAEQLPKLDIPSCYLSLYEDPRPYRYPQPAPEWSRLILAYSEVDTAHSGGRIELEPGGRRFRSQELIPEGMWPQGRRYSFIVKPLYFQEHQLGFVLFEVGSRDGMVYEMLRRQISSALWGAHLVQQVEERRQELQEANYALQRRAIQIEASAEVGRAITSIFDIDELLQQTATLISDRFGFYHVGIFLVDAAGEWAVLREATGRAGAQMKAEGHRLAVGDTSMVGWTAAHRQPRIALDVGEDPVRFAHPLLPHTRSEMTLPLAVGDQLLGVLNVQSTEEAAFDQDDVRALQSMADQVAIAIQNARRVSDETALLESTSPVYRTSRLLTTATTRTEVADAIIASVGETGADGCLVVEFEFSPAGDPEALLYLGVWRRDREPQFQAGMRLPIAESPFPLEMVSTLWTVADVDQDDRLPRSARVVFQATGARALVNIPLRSGERVIGQVVVIRATPGPFTEAALRLYEVLSDQAAVALERAELLEEAQQRAAREQQARQMIDRIRRAVDLEQALEIAAEELSQAMQVPHVSVNLGVDAVKQE